MQVAFYQSESEQPHPGRARAIIKAHPEVRELMVRNPWTALIAVSILLVQTALAFGMGQLGFGYWWLSLLLAFCIGAFGNHVVAVTMVSSSNATKAAPSNLSPDGTSFTDVWYSPGP